MNFETILKAARQKVDDSYIELEDLYEQLGGVYWSSGGGCMILSILISESKVVCVSDTYVCQYEPLVESCTLEDLIYMDEDKTHCTKSEQIVEPRTVYLVKDSGNIVRKTWYYNRSTARTEWPDSEIIEFKEVMK